MKPKNLKFPFSWDDRRPVLIDRVLFVPQYYEKHAEWEFPGFTSPEVFARPAPVYVEYCSGNGAWIIEKAQQHPECNWVAVEKRFDRVRKIWSKRGNLGLSNLLVVAGEACAFTRYYLPDGCVVGCYINFPDPWPKGKHAKHRLFHEVFVREMSRVVESGGKTTIVTDDPTWTGRIARAMHTGLLWEPLFPDPFYVTEWPDYGASYFGDLWHQKGRTIHYLQFKNQKVS